MLNADILEETLSVNAEFGLLARITDVPLHGGGVDPADRAASAGGQCDGAGMSVVPVLLGRPRPWRRADVVDVPAPTGPPSMRSLARELAGPVELARLLRSAPWLAVAPRGDGQTVIDLPGWKAPEASSLPLRSFLRFLGYHTRPWGLGTNRGTPERDAEQLADALAARSGEPPVALVGMSLGGTVAREIARAVPERVACVVTLGSPVIGGPTPTIGARTVGRDECARLDALARRLDAEQPIQVPITTVYTRRDGVVDWRACIDHASPHVEHVEVRSTHLGLGVDPDVWSTVAHALATAPWTASEAAA
jgi:pimeloyl-ACP methyl ester carboxylesterase